MGLISSRISASPERACGSPAVRAAHASLPTSQSKDSVWMARRLGTSRCSVILPNETRRGANALDVRLVFAGREAAKMRPSEDLCCVTAVSRAPQSTRRKLPKEGHCRRDTDWEAAQTSSVAERLTAVERRDSGPFVARVSIFADLSRSHSRSLAPAVRSDT